VIARTRVPAAALEEVIAEETARLAGYRLKFLRPERPSLKDKAVLIVDDGLATGATMEVAVRSAKTRQANEVTVAVPVASENSVERLSRVADNVLALLVDSEFDAVGRYYRSFPQTSDEEVMKVLGIAG
jgi:predicted phosphoribosyltransferase